MFKRFFKNKLTNLLLSLIEGLDSERKANLFSKLKSSFYLEQYNKYRKVYSVHESFRFNGDNVLFYGRGRIICGKNSYIGSSSTIQALEDCIVQIGDNCSISHNVRVYTTSNISNQDLNTQNPKAKKTGNVIIHNGVWIGANVFINPGITIGENAVVGSNSVVTKDVEAYAIYGGVPAKLIKHKNYNK